MNTNTNMNSRIINTLPWGLPFNRNFDIKNSSYKYTGSYADALDKGNKSKRLKLFDTNVPDYIPMDVVDDDEEEVGLVKQQRTLPPLRMETDTDTASESDEDEEEDDEEDDDDEEDEEEDIPDTVLTRQTTFWNDADIDIVIPEMPVLRRQTTSWVNKYGFTVYNGCPFGNRLMNDE
jgi:hypothetical protein